MIEEHAVREADDETAGTAVSEGVGGVNGTTAGAAIDDGRGEVGNFTYWS